MVFPEEKEKMENCIIGPGLVNLHGRRVQHNLHHNNIEIPIVWQITIKNILYNL